jgi:ATP/maltotriose-dependent transcriptional regulator MalT
MAEMLEGQPSEVQSMLLRTSLVDRMNRELAPSLSTSGETLTIEESMTLRARTENRRTCRRRARMQLEQRRGLLAPAAKTSAA